MTCIAGSDKRRRKGESYLKLSTFGCGGGRVTTPLDGGGLVAVVALLSCAMGHFSSSRRHVFWFF